MKDGCDILKVIIMTASLLQSLFMETREKNSKQNQTQCGARYRALTLTTRAKANAAPNSTTILTTTLSILKTNTIIASNKSTIQAKRNVCRRTTQKNAN